MCSYLIKWIDVWRMEDQPNAKVAILESVGEWLLTTYFCLCDNFLRCYDDHFCSDHRYSHILQSIAFATIIRTSNCYSHLLSVLTHCNQSHLRPFFAYTSQSRLRWLFAFTVIIRTYDSNNIKLYDENHNSQNFSYRMTDSTQFALAAPTGHHPLLN